MAKLTLTTIGSRYGSVDALNANFDAIEQAFQDVLYRDGSTPNFMEANLDMNTNDILNVGTLSATDVVVGGSSVAASAASAAASASAASASASSASASAASAAADAVTVNNAKLIWRGSWSGATAYAVNDAVVSSGTSYICKLAHTNQVPPNASYWDVLAQKGADGAAGTGSGDASTNTATSVDNELVLFSGTSGKLLKRSASTGIAKLTSGVLSTAVAGTDYLEPAAIGVTVQGYDAATAKTNVAQTYTAGQRGGYTVLTDGATITPNFALGNMFRVQLGGNRTLDNPSNLVAGQSGCIDIHQDSTGSRTLAYAWGWDFPNGNIPVLSTAARAKDKLSYQVDVYAQSTVTITIAAPGVVSWTAHGLLAGQQVRLTTTGALPTGLAVSTTYFVVPVDANSFQLAATQSGTAITTTGSQSGTHTMTAISITGQLLGAIA